MKTTLRIALIATALLCGVSHAAGVKEPAIGLDFPEKLGVLALKGRQQFPNTSEGAVIAYEGGGTRGAVYVYNAGKASIPNGVGSPIIHEHFQQTEMALKRAASQGGNAARITPVKNSTISAFKGCGPQFMWRSDAIAMGGGEMISRTYLTGYNNQFVKLRVTHPRGKDGDAEQFVQEVRSLLGKCG